MRVVLAVRKGPMLGRHREVELGPDPSNRLVIGRDPGPGGWLLEGDTTVSRRHGELFAQHGQVVYENASSNGTLVDGSTVLGRAVLHPGSVVGLGGHEIEVRYRPIAATRAADADGSLWTSGPLANPVVRVGLGVYLLALLAVALVLGLRGQSDASAELREARSSYERTYLPSLALAPEHRDARLRRAEHLAAELEAHLQAERWSLADATCRQLMALDGGDPASPLFVFATDRLGAMNLRRRR